MTQRILDLLNDPAPEVKRRGLGLLLRQEAFELLPDAAKLVAQPDRETARSALVTILALADRALKTLDRPVSERSLLTAAGLIRKFQPDYADRLLSTLELGVAETAIPALAALRHLLDDARARETLIQFLHHADPKIRATSALHMGLAAGRRYSDILSRPLEDADPRVRANAIEALGRLNNKRLARVVQRFRSDDHPRVRANALKALHAMEVPGVEDELRAMLTHPLAAMRASGVWVVGEIALTQKEILSYLRVLQSEREPVVLRGLSALRRRLGDIPEVEFLRQVLEQERIRELQRKMASESDTGLVFVKHDREGYGLFRLSGDMVVSKLYSFKQALLTLDIKKQPVLALDLAEVQNVDSSGLALLMNFGRKLEAIGGSLILLGVNDRILDLFKVTGLREAVHILTNEDEIRELVL